MGEGVRAWPTKTISLVRERHRMMHSTLVTNPNARPTRRVTRGRIAAALASSANHDLRTPLATVLGMAELLEHTDLTPRQESYVSAIRRAGEAMLAVIDAQREASEGAVTSAAGPRPVEGVLSGRRLLVVDDSDESYEIVGSFLEDAGASLVRVRDGSDAVATLGRERFDAVLMDMHLTGMDGVATTRAIRRAERERLERSIPIIGLSADASSQSARRALAAGCAAYVSKPTNRDALVDVLVSHVVGAPVVVQSPPSALPQLLPKFVANRERDVVVLREAFEKGELDAIAEIAHKLHGNGASYGFPELSAIGRDLEAAARAREEADVAQCLQRLAAAVVGLRRGLPDSNDMPRPRSVMRIRVDAPLLVLIVDDFADSRAMYAEHFRDEGFDVVEAADGSAAIVRARERLPAVIVMDLSLPGMDGWDAIRELKHDDATRSIPIVALTGHCGTGDADGAKDAGCDTFLTKPCLPSALLEKVNELLAARAVAARR